MKRPDHATTTPLQWVRVIPVAIRPRSASERRALAIASDENPDHRQATKVAMLAALVIVLLLVAAQLLGCAPSEKSTDYLVGPLARGAPLVNLLCTGRRDAAPDGARRT